MADFPQAIKWIIEGKKVFRECWENKKLYLSKEKYSNFETVSGGESKHSSYMMNTLEDFEATDWEIFEEKKETLSDKVFNDGHLLKQDVKKHIKILREKVGKDKYENLKGVNPLASEFDRGFSIACNHFHIFIRETFGEKLC